MTNYFAGNPIVLDTFSAAIDVCKSCGFETGTPIKLSSIAWSAPTTVGDTCTITDSYGGHIVFQEKCSVANQGVTKYFLGAFARNLCITGTDGGVSSGKVIIELE